MKLSTSFITAVSLLCGLFITTAAHSDEPPRMRRADSFFGIHFDFHAGKDCTEIGKTVTPEMIQRVIDQTHPDYIQCDCKGHAGFSSYPTKVGNPAPGFVRDQLKIWREVTAQNGVALYLHYSGVWDSEAVRIHPEWACVNADGSVDDRMTSVFGPYRRELLIPQLKELNDEYGIDGVWVDGECWATKRDYGEKAARLFREATGITVPPKSQEDANWFEFSEFHRQGFRDHLKEYTDALHAHNPSFQVCSNWAFSSHMPEPIGVDVDFISGDFSARNSVNAGRFEGRCMAHQGKPWDLMAWSFSWSPGIYSSKTAPQLKREAAVVMSLGGGFQAYFPQNRDGSVRPWEWDANLMGEVADFCRKRQEYCHKAESVPQIGLIYSTHAFYRKAHKVFSAWHGEHNAMRGILQNLLDTQHVVDIVSEHHLEGRIDDFPVLVYPEWGYIDPAFKNELIGYVRRGGTLLLVGPASAGLFGSELGVTFVSEPEKRINGLHHGGWLAGLDTESVPVKLASDTEQFGDMYFGSRNNMEGPVYPAASYRKLGKGTIAAIHLNLGERYLDARTSVAKSFLGDFIDELFSDQIVSVSGSHDVDVTLARKDNRLMVNLINTSGPHENDRIFVIDEITSVGPVTVSVAMDKKPERITLQPGNRDVHYQFIDNRAIMSIPEVPIHEIVMIEE